MTSPIRRRDLLLLASVVGIMGCGAASANVLYWDPTAGVGTPSGGAGTWNTNTTSNWSNLTSDVKWTDTTGTDTAVFGGTAGTVTLSGTNFANALVFNTSAYSLTGGTLNLAGTSPTITAKANASIGSIITGSSGVTFAGTAILTLSAANTYTGQTVFTGPTLAVSNAAAFGTSTLNFSGGAIYTTTAVLTFTNAIFSAPGTITNIYGTNGGSTYPKFTGAVTGSGTIENANTTGTGTGNAFINGDISQFTGTIAFVDASIADNFQFAGGGNNYNGSQAHFVLSGTGTGGALYIAETAAAVMQMGDLSGSGGIISSVTSDTLQIGALNTSPGVYAGRILAGSGIALTKIGTGTLAMSGVNTYAGGTNISAGAVNIQGNGGLGTGAVSVASGAVLQLQGGVSTTSANALTLTGSGLAANPNGALDSISGNNTYSGLMTLASNTTISSDTALNTLTLSNVGTINGSGSNLTLTGAGNGTLAGIIGTGAAGVIKTGSGSWALSGANTYSGTTNVSSGTLSVNGSLNPASVVTVGSGGTLGGSGTVSSTVTVLPSGGVLGGQSGVGTLNLSGLTFNGSGTVNVGTLANYGSTTAINAGALSTNGSNSITVNVASVTGTIVGHTYDLLNYSGGAIAGTGYGAFQLGTLPSRTTGTLTNNTAAGQIDLTITGTDFLKWTGAGNLANGWDTSSSNWKLNSNSAVTTYIDSPGDAVVFDDSAPSANTTVNINTADVHPSSLTFNNSANTYTIGGSHAIAGSTGLTMSGTGVVNLTSSNTYTGVTAINKGTVNFSTNSLGAGNITFGGGTLAYASGNTQDVSARLKNSTAPISVNIGSGAITLGTSIDSSNTGGLTVLGTGTLTLPVSSGYSGTTTLAGPTVFAGNASAFGTGQLNLSGGALTTTAGTALTFNNPVYVVPNTITNLYGYSGAGGGDPKLAGAITGSGTIAANNSTGSLGNSFINGDISQFTGTFAYVNNSPSENFQFVGATANSSNGSQAHFVLSGAVSGTATMYAGETAGAIFQMGDLSGPGGQISGLNGTTLQIGALNTSPGAFAGSITNAGGISVIKVGTGTLTLSGVNTYAGGTNVSAGAVNIQGNSALGTGAVSVSSGAALQLQGGVTTSASVPLTISGTGVAASPSGALESISGNNTYSGSISLGADSVISSDAVGGTLTLNNSTTAISGSSNLTLAGAGKGVISSAIGTGGGLTMAGPGTWTLSGSNTYSGPTNVSGGKLYVSSALPGSNTTVFAGATLGGTGLINGPTTVLPGGIIEAGQSGAGSLTLNGLTFNGSGAVNIGLVSNYSAAPAINSGSLSTTGSNTVTINVSSLSGAVVGTAYELIGYTGGSVGGTGSGAFMLGTLPSRAVGTLSDNGTQIDLTLTGVDFLKWTGAGSLASGWDTTTPNWKLNSNGTPTTYVDPTDSVVFDDSASPANTTVNINTAPVHPSSVTFNNSANTYTLQGSFGIAGPTGVMLSGSGLVILATPNSYTGTTTLNNGTLNVASGALGTGSITFGGGTLQYATGMSQDISGQLVNSTGPIAIDTGSNAVAFNSNIGSTNTAGITKLGIGTLTLSGSNSFAGDTTIVAGTVVVESAASLPLGSNLTFGNANTGSNITTLKIDSGITANVSLGQINTTNYGTGSIILLNSGSALAINKTALYATLNLAGSVPLTLVATNTGGHGTPQDWLGAIIGSGITSGNTALILDGTSAPLRLTFGGADGITANNFTGDVLIKGAVTTQNTTFNGPYPSDQNLGFLNNNVNVSSGATWRLVWGSETMGALSGSGNISFATQPVLNNIGLTIGNNSTPSGVFSGGISGIYGIVKVGSGTQTMAGSSSYTGGTTVNGGTLIFAAPGALPSYTSLTIASNAYAVAANHATGVTSAAKNNLFVTSLSLAGNTGSWSGQLDLGNNDMVVRNGSNTSLATINNQVAQGYSNGNWNGPGGIVSSAAAADSSHLTALGVILNDNGSGSATALYSTFDGATTGEGDVLVKYTYYGDTDLNGEVDGTDYSRIDAACLADQTSPGSMTGWFNGDFNYDGVIDGSDYTLIDNAFNTQGAQLSAEIAAPTAQIAGAGIASAVPEPASLGFLGFGAAGLLGRRRRR